MQANLTAQRSQPCDQAASQPAAREAHQTSAQDPTDSSAGARIASLLAESRELCVQIEQLRSERNTLAEQQRQIQELLKSSSPARIIHDLRNLLNERALLKALVNDS